MVSLKDVERNTFPTSSYRFEYLLATCKVQQLTLSPEKDDDQEEHPSTSKNDKPKPKRVFKVIRIAEEEKEGICLRKLRRLGKVTTKPRSDAVSKSGVSSSSDGSGETAPESIPSPIGKRKRSRNAGAAEKRKCGGNGGNNIQEPPPGMPERIKNLILHPPENQEASAAKLVIQKKLTDTDVSNTHNRLSIPMKHLQQTFLTEEEEVQLRTRNGKNVGSMDVPLITPAMETATVSLRRWEMMKARGPSSVSYVLTSTWNKIREENGLKSGMNVQLWAVRVDNGRLCFALTSLV